MNLILANLIVDYFLKGGPIMWPILVALLAAITVVLQRSLWWIEPATCAPTPTALADSFDAIAAGEFDKALRTHRQRQRSVPANRSRRTDPRPQFAPGRDAVRASDELERGERLQWVLGTLITLAPLLGLLGTITGIMRSFSFVGDEQLAPTKVSGGIAEALIATACGLGIAILCLLPYNYFNRRLSHFRAQLERTINHVELLAASARHHGHDLEEFAAR